MAAAQSSVPPAIFAREWDFIVAGAGSSGAALAARLAQKQIGSVLLIEAGMPDNWHWLRIPIGVAPVLLGDRAVKRYFTEAEAHLGGRRIFWPRGRVPGGSSRINGMIWARGDPAEYAHWAAMDLPGWDYDSLLPYFQSIERYDDPRSRTRGRTGPVHVSRYSPCDPLTQGFLDACARLGMPTVQDYNDGRYQGAGVLQLSTRNGLRCSTKEAFLDPALRLDNFCLASGLAVERIMCEHRKAVGVIVRRDGVTHAIKARAEVIVCGGAIQSPQLLQLSGIGDAARLSQLALPVVHHLAGVGANLIDHLHVRVNVRARNVRTVNELMNGWPAKVVEGMRFLLHRDGMLATATCTAHALARTRDDDPQADVKLQLHNLTSPDARDPHRYVLDPHPGFSVGVFQLRPHSRGSVQIASGDPQADPLIVANYLADKRDREALLRGLRLARKVIQQPDLDRFAVEEIRPGRAVVDDDALLAWAGTCGSTSYHPVGTCRMGGDADAAAVVDHRLRVHGMNGLRVADASIMPTMPSSNINAACIAIGAKAADLVAEDLRR